MSSSASLLGAGILAVAATASKETGITAPATAAAIDVLDALPASTPRRARLLCALRCCLAAALDAALLLGSRSLRGEQMSPYFSFVDNPLPSLPTRSSRIMSALHIHVRYARLLLWPATLSADYSFDCIPAVTEYDDTRNLAAAALYASLLWIGIEAVLAARKASVKDDDDNQPWRSCGRALIVLLLPMVPASHALLGIGTLMAERLLYLPSVGYCVLLGVAASSILKLFSGPKRHHRLLRMIFALLLLSAAGLGVMRTRDRNLDWADSDSITNATAHACPGSAKAQISLGTMHLQRKEHTPARTAFRAALRIHPTYCDALYWLGRLSFMEGKLIEAEPLLLAAIEINPGHPEANLFGALCAARRGDDTSALTLLTRAHELAPHNAEIVRDYGAMLLRAGQPKKALKVLKRAVGLLGQLHTLGDKSAHSRGALASAQMKLSAALLTLNQHAECISAAGAAAALEPSIASALSGLQKLCERGRDEGLDTSKVKIDLAL